MCTFTQLLNAISNTPFEQQSAAVHATEPLSSTPRCWRGKHQNTRLNQAGFLLLHRHSHLYVHHIGGSRQIVHHSVQEGLHTLVLEGRPARHRHKGAVDGTLADQTLHGLLIRHLTLQCTNVCMQLCVVHSCEQEAVDVMMCATNCEPENPAVEHMCGTQGSQAAHEIVNLSAPSQNTCVEHKAQ